jgi:hypothetical protein
VKIDLSPTEVVVRPTVLQRISHVYPDKLPEPATVRCYSFEELFAEKIRAMGERSRPRDLYDIINLFRRDDLQAVPSVIREALHEKCRTKGVPVPTLAAITASPHYAELESEWANMLGHQLQALPPLPDFIEELPNLFSWLEGAFAPEALEAAPATKEEAAEEEAAAAAGTPSQVWSPPPTTWVWGRGGVSLESIRFAAVNHLCVELGYEGTKRVIEPYSLRQTRAGNLLLHSIKVETREPRAYRVDRIESITVLSQTFKPEYAIEFSASGRINAPPSAPRARRTVTRQSTKRRIATGRVSIIECPWCHRRFERSTDDTTLGEHKDKRGYRCGGSGASGWLKGYK